MKWTSEKPKKPGYYWYRTAVGVMGIDYVWADDFGCMRGDKSTPVSAYGGGDCSWAGPIPQPEEA